MCPYLPLVSDKVRERIPPIASSVRFTAYAQLPLQKPRVWAAGFKKCTATAIQAHMALCEHKRAVHELQSVSEVSIMVADTGFIPVSVLPCLSQG